MESVVFFESRKIYFLINNYPNKMLATRQANKNRTMLKLKMTFTLIIGLQIIGFGQWEERNISTVSTLTSVHFVTEDIGYVVGGNTIYKTENGAEDWDINYNAGDDVLYEDIFVIDNNNIIAIGKDVDSNQSIITKSEDGGNSWIEIPLSTTQLLRSIFFITPTTGYCSGGGGIILKTVDSGSNWVELNSGTNLSLQSIFFVDEMIGFAVGGSPIVGIALKTEDGGQTWSELDSQTTNYLQSVYFTTKETGYIVGWNGEILKTNDCGVTWNSLNSVSMTGNLEITFTDANTAYIVGGADNESLIQKTSSGGDSFEDISPQTSYGLISVQFPSFEVGYAVGFNGSVVKTESEGLMTSTNGLNSFDKFRVFPNPTSGNLNILAHDSNLIEVLKIYNSNGMLLAEMTPSSYSYDLDLSNLAADIYYLEIQSKDLKSIKRIVKR